MRAPENQMLVRAKDMAWKSFPPSPPVRPAYERMGLQLHVPAPAPGGGGAPPCPGRSPAASTSAGSVERRSPCSPSVPEKYLILVCNK